MGPRNGGSHAATWSPQGHTSHWDPRKKQQIPHLVVETKHELICLEGLPAKAGKPAFFICVTEGGQIRRVECAGCQGMFNNIIFTGFNPWSKYYASLGWNMQIQENKRDLNHPPPKECSRNNEDPYDTLVLILVSWCPLSWEDFSYQFKLRKKTPTGYLLGLWVNPLWSHPQYDHFYGSDSSPPQMVKYIDIY